MPSTPSTPSTPYDAKGLLKGAIRDEDPVVFLAHKLLYMTEGPAAEIGEYGVKVFALLPGTVLLRKCRFVRAVMSCA